MRPCCLISPNAASLFGQSGSLPSLLIFERCLAAQQGWNKKATVEYVLHEYEESLQDCQRCVGGSAACNYERLLSSDC